MVDSNRISEAANSALEKTENAAGQVKDALKEAGSDAYDRGAELVEQRPGSALLLAGIVGFALGFLCARGSQPRRNSLQQYYDRYGR